MPFTPRELGLGAATLVLSVAAAMQSEPTAEQAADRSAWSADQQAVHDALEDYVIGFYRGDTERLARSLSEDLVKKGYRRSDSDGGWSDPLHLTFETALELAGSRNLEERNGGPLPYSVELFEVCDKTACGKVTAVWGQDTFQLVKEGEAWKIHHILWQSAPETIER